MLDAAIAGVALAVLPPGLMGLAHAYALATQDKKAWCVVVVDNRVRSLHRVTDDHKKRYHVVIVQEWDALTKGYRARIPVKYIEAIEHDRRVQIIQSWEQDEFLNPDTAFAHVSH